MKSTPDLCDEYPQLVRVAKPLFTNYGARKQFYGPVVTVKCFEDNSRVKELVATEGRGRVLVVDGGGSMRRALLGDMLAAQASNNGWSGIIIYGCIRDIDEIMQTDIGVQALGVHPIKTEKRGIGEIDIELTFAGVCFRPDDFCYADNNGIISSPTALNIL
jgi:regulator of ribonuclease activity A